MGWIKANPSEELHERVRQYADAHDLNMTDATTELVRKGMEAHDE